jgi:dipeptide/tripeptide permease
VIFNLHDFTHREIFSHSNRFEKKETVNSVNGNGVIVNIFRRLNIVEKAKMETPKTEEKSRALLVLGFFFVVLFCVFFSVERQTFTSR